MSSVSLSDTHIIEQVLSGHRDSFSVLLERYLPIARAVALAHMRNADDADDVAQEAILKAYTKLATLKNTQRFGAWLTTITRNIALTALRRQSRHTNYTSSVRPEIVLEPDITQRELYARVRGYVDELPPKLRECVLLRYFAGQTLREISSLLNITTNAVEKRIVRARASLGERILDELMPQDSQNANSKNLSKLMSLVAVAPPPWEALGVTASVSTIATSTIIGGIIMTKKVVIGISACVAILLGLWIVSPEPKEELLPDAIPFVVEVDEALVEEDTSPSPIEMIPEKLASTEPVAETPSVEVIIIKEEETEPGKILDPDLYATVSGYVVNASGEAIPSADVTLIATGAAQGENEGEADLNTFFYKDAFKEEFNQAVFSKEHHFTTRTSNTGAFTISGIAYEGQCIVVASADHHSTRHATIVLAKGESRSGIRMTLRPGLTFVGRVVTQGGLPVTDAVVREVGGAVGSSYWAGGRGRIAATDENGHFRMGLSGEGVTMFHVVSPTAGQQTFNGIEFDGLSVITLEMRPMASLNARLSWDDGTPAAGLPVKLIGIYTIEIMHGENTSSSTDTGGVIHAVVSEDGQYVFEGLDPGQSYVMDIFDAEGEIMVEHAQVGDIKSGEEFQWHHVIDAPIYITGKVTGTKSGRALKGIKVFYMKKNTETLIYGYEYTDEHGAYYFKLLSGTGTYAIFPLYGHQNFMYSSGDPNQQLVELRGGADHEVNLIFPEPVSLSFLVEDENGTPLSGVHVELPSGIGGSQSNFSRDLYTDENGRFTYDGFLPNREIKVIFSHESFASTESLNYIGESEEVYPVERVILYGAAGLQGVALLENGTPLSSQRVKATVLFEDGKEIHLYATTDLDGYFAITKGVPATEISVRVSFGETTWHSARFQAIPGETIDLGIVQ